MARAPELSRNARAFLDMLAWAEGTSTSPITRDDGYDIIVTGIHGRERFDDYSMHPFARGRQPKQINYKGLYSTASGRYQHILRTWNSNAGLWGFTDFSPINQDRSAWQLIRGKGAHHLIEKGMIEDAISLVRKEWASLPGAGYKDQRERKMLACLAAYDLNGGLRWNSLPVYSAESGAILLPESSPLLPSSELRHDPEVRVDETPRPTSLGEMFAQLLKRLTNRHES